MESKIDDTPGEVSTFKEMKEQLAGLVAALIEMKEQLTELIRTCDCD